MTTKISVYNLDNTVTSAIGSGGGGVIISSLQIATAAWVVKDDTAVDTAGGFAIINGSGFASGCNVIIGSQNATAVSFVSSTTLRVTIPAQAAGTYTVYVVNPNGAVGIIVNGLTYSGTPSWVTGSTLTSGQVNSAISIQLSATGESVTYALQAGSSLPSGLTLTSGGLLSGTVTGITSETTYNFTIEAIDAQAQDSPRAFSITISANDADFRNVSLLLSANTPGNTFVSDASNNAFAITVNGDTRPNNFGPYTPGYYSNFFDGTGDYLTVPYNASLVQWWDTDYTIEMWVYNRVNAVSGTNSLPLQVAHGNPNDNTTYWAFGTNASGNLYFYYYNGSPVTNAVSTSTVSLNAWTHLAMVYNNTTSTLKGYINGVESFSVAKSGTPQANSGNTLNIGRVQSTDYTGNISNLRIVKGTAVYTANFTPSTTPLTAIANTSLLTCSSNRLIDTSNNAFAITRNGDVRVDGFDPFVPASNTATFGSGYFDGNGDYLSLPAAQTALQPGNGNFTIEFWYYISTAPGGYINIFSYGAAGASLRLFLFTTNSFTLFEGATLLITANNSVIINAWNHVAVVRNGTTIVLYVNGVSVGSVTNSSNFVNNLNIGFETGQTSYTGHLSNFRLVKGTAVYTSAFTPPTEPLTAIANTSLLTLQTNQPINNHMFVDNSTVNNLITRAGNATQGSFSPYSGSWSNYFDGTGDWLTFTGATTGSGNFTTEAWVYLATLRDYQVIFDNRATGASATGYAFGVDAAGKPYMYTNNAFQILSSIVITANTWNHVALVRSGTTITLYVNGVSGGTYTSSANFSDTNNGIGVAPTFTPTSQFFGYISNLRVLNGTALYTTTFTPVTQPLLPIANTTLLTCNDNRFLDDSNNNFTLTRSGDISVQKFSPFTMQTQIVPTSYSVYFDGTGDYLTIPDNAAFDLGSSNFTFEVWVYPTSAFTTSTEQFLLDQWASANYGYEFSLITNGTSFTGVRFAYSQTGAVGNITTRNYTQTIPLNSWSHIAIVRNSGTTTAYYNGTSIGTSSDNVTIFNSTQTVHIGASPDGGINQLFYGYLSNMRLVKGTAVYTSAFTPPTAPLTAIANTSLLACQSTTLIDNSNNAFAITQNGDARPIQQNPFGYTNANTTAYTTSLLGGSMRFDGTGDSLSVATNSLSAMGSGDFTIELWHYALPKVSTYPIILSNWTATWGANLWSLHDRHADNGPTKYTFWVNNFNANSPLLTSNAVVREYQWTHVAITRSGSTWRMYINGALDVTATSSVALDAGTTYPISVGVTSGSSNLNGYISDVRFLKGQAFYRNAFVPPQAPLTAASNTTLLLSGTSAGVYDSASIDNLETVGGAAINTSIVKFAGKSSIFFNGTNSGLFSVSSPNFSFGSGDFTIEFWYYPTSTAGTNPAIMTNWSGTGSFTSGQWTLHAPHSVHANKYSLWVASSSTSTALLVSTSNIATNTWTHIAITRTTNTWRMFINGTIEATATHSGVFDSGGSWPRFIGYQPNADSGRYITGYISDLRCSKGVSRYTTNFTPATTPLIQF